MIETIQLRRDTAANWTSLNPVLGDCEAGVERDTKKAKLGDGATAWNSLPYWNPSGTGGGGGAVASVFGRSGAVSAQSGDYTASQVGADASGAASAALASAETYAASQAAAAQAAAEAASTPVLARAAVQAANYTAPANQIVPCNISGGSFTVTLPPAPANGTVAAAEITAVSGAGVNALTVACAGSDVFDAPGGAVSITLTLQHQSVLLVYGGGVWARVSGRDSYLEVAQNRLGTFYLDQYAGTDDQKMTLALAAVVAAGGPATVQLSPRAHSFADPWAIPNSSPLTSSYAVRILGTGSSMNGQDFAPGAVTGVTFTGVTGASGNGAGCIDAENTGTAEIAYINFTLASSTTVPLLQDTNATLFFHDNTVTGAFTGAACTQSGIVLGGGSTGSGIGSGPGAKFNGYGTVIERNQFHGLQHVITFRHGCNGVRFLGNFIDGTCGSAVPLDAPVILNGGGASNALQGNVLRDNLIEITHYQAGVSVTQAYGCELGPNNFWDPPASGFTACYLIDATSTYNRVADTYRSPGVPLILDYSGTTAVTALQPGSAQNYWPQNTATLFQSSPWAVQNGGGVLHQDSYGDRAGWTAAFNTQGYPSLAAQITPCSQATDGVVYAGSPNLVSVSAVFVSTDIGESVRLSGAFPLYSLITGVWTHSFAPAWQASTSYVLGAIVIPGTANGHLYQCTTAGTTASSAPTWPTGGGTVTDGTAVWADLGTAATCAVLTQPSTSTATGQTFNWSRASGSAQQALLINRYHIVSQGSVPAWVPNTAAGSGASAAVASGSSDLSQEITLTTGTGPASGLLATGSPAVNFNYRSPKCWLSPKNAATATLMSTGGGAWLTASTSQWTLNCNTAPQASTAYIFDIISME